MLVLTTKRGEEGMEGMEEENSCPFVPLDNALGGPRPTLGVWWPAQGSHTKSR